MALFDRIFKKDAVSNDTNKLLNALTNLTSEDIEVLGKIARGETTKSEDTSLPRSLLDVVDGAFSRYTAYGENSPQTRKQLYSIYDEMDDSVAYVSAALDIVSDDATQPDQDGVIIKVTSESDKVKALTQDMIDNFELEEKISKWARLVAKYGDFFIKLKYKNGEGITKILDDVYPSLVERHDLDGELLAFSTTDEALTHEVFPPWEFVHFKHKGDIPKDVGSFNDLQNGKAGHSLYSSYGQSLLRPAIKVYAQLRFVENMLLLSRLTNSVRRNIFMINVGDVAPDKSYETIANYATLLKKNISLDLETNVYNSQRKTMSYDEDIFIPVADPKNDVRIEQVGGDVNIAEQYDLEYLLNKLFSALKIPKAYLNYEQDLNARSTLVQLDIRYARSVARIQQTLRGGLLRLARINLAMWGIDPDGVEFDIQLTPVSTIDAEAKRQELKDKAEVANTLWRTFCDINDKLLGGGQSANPVASIFGGAQDASGANEESETPVDLKYAAECIMSKYLDLSTEEVDKLLRKESDDNKKKKVTFHKVSSSNPDIHAPLPLGEATKDFEVLRENLVEQLVKTSSEPND